MASNFHGSVPGDDLENLIQALGLEARQCHYWAAHSGPEIDLIVQRGSRLRGFEIKRTSSPTLTRSMRSAMDDLGLSRLDVIHAGEHSFPLARHVDLLHVILYM